MSRSRGGLLAAVDQGSTTTKAALIDREGSCRKICSRQVERRVDGPRVTHDAEGLARGVEEVVAEILDQGPVDGLALTCQRSTCLIWERESGRPLTPALSWQDLSRSGQAVTLAAHGEEVSRRTGLRLSPHYAALKLSHLLEELPQGRRRAESGELVAGTLDAFLMQRLTGRASTEPGHAGRTLLYDLEKMRWDPWLCELFGVPQAALPSLLPSGGERGSYRGTPVLALAGDQQAALLGQGGWRQEVTAAHFGTGAFVLASTGGSPRRHPGLLTAALASLGGDVRYQLEGSINSAGSAVDWACALTGRRIEEWDDRVLEPDSLPLVFPAFAGVAAPWWRPEARACASGLRLDTGPGELVGGVLLGIGLRVVDCLEALKEADQAIRVLRVSGRLTRLRGLAQLLADAGQVIVEVSAEEESGLAGVARLAAAVGGGQEALTGSPTVSTRHEPSWSPSRAGEIRGRWLDLVERTLAE